ncbi:hypothetical protein F1737_05945 [Methanoplanus sp. FWC-SCC4]|uniref:DUF3821 domain-containing protein n=1 Tax=Methanochimaera problematica TaxID=2609417 RepID=A0AA97I3V3_9EURY|nr:hypothetical protein [Methanoplanus sp. FWC-SCC4]WOF16286.1 hypothetical protein F1737_05945 [Methanoplanus sp. FWC-SCC4]
MSYCRYKKSQHLCLLLQSQKDSYTVPEKVLKSIDENRSKLHLFHIIALSAIIVCIFAASPSTAGEITTNPVFTGLTDTDTLTIYKTTVYPTGTVTEPAYRPGYVTCPKSESATDDYFLKERHISSGFEPEIKLNPLTTSGGTLAKGQTLFVSGKAQSDSEIGIWLYKDGIGNPDKNRFVKLQTDKSGDIIGDGMILDRTRSHKLPSGKYFLYIVSGDSDFINSGFFPDTNREFEEKLKETEVKNPYLKVMLLAEEPWIYYDQQIIADVPLGKPVTIKGTTNLAVGTSLFVTVEPTSTDDPLFHDQIIEVIQVTKGDDYNLWELTFQTSELGFGEYIISVEGADITVDSVSIFNIYDETYAAENPGNDSILVKSYSIDSDSKNLAENSESTEGYIVKSGTKNSDGFTGTLSSPLESAFLVCGIALILGIFRFYSRRRG